MEPLNATALYTPDKCEVWTRHPERRTAFAAAVQASGLPPAKCDVHKVMLGGGFGRRTAPDYVRQAVLIAKQMPGTPVKLLWSREEDMTHGRYHPVTQCKLTGAIRCGRQPDRRCTCGFRANRSLPSITPQVLKDGMDLLRSRASRPGEAFANIGPARLGYTIPNFLIDHSMRNPHVPPGVWRGVNGNQNGIYLECFMDELAHAAGQDPLAFRPQADQHPKHLAVLNAVAERVGWGNPRRKAYFAASRQHDGTRKYVAAAAEISVVGDNKIKVHRIVAATDPGMRSIRRRSSGRSQAHSSMACRRCSTECTVKDGRIEQTNFDTYNSMHIARDAEGGDDRDAERRLLGRRRRADNYRRGAGGAQRYFGATGKQIRSVPLKNHDVVFA